MDLTLVAAGSLLLVGTGYAVVRRAHRFRIGWRALVCVSLFALATRDLFQPRERRSPAQRGDDQRADATRDRSAGETRSTRSPLLARLRRRFAGWLD